MDASGHECCWFLNQEGRKSGSFFNRERREKREKESVSRAANGREWARILLVFLNQEGL
jgi:hypothetical protein